MSQNDKMLAKAIAIGEEAVKKNIVLELRFRKLRWHVYKARHQLAHGKAQEALHSLNELLDIIDEGLRCG